MKTNKFITPTKVNKQVQASKMRTHGLRHKLRCDWQNNGKTQ